MGATPEAPSAPPAQEILPSNQEEFDNCCRICLGEEGEDRMIKPCLCTSFIHTDCLDEWRAQERIPRAFTHCPTCQFQYQTMIIEDTPRSAFWAKMRFRFFVARDMGAIFVSLQLLLMGFAKLIHLVDKKGEIAKLYPEDWVTKHSAMFSIGPYYCTAAIVFFALVGLGGLIHKFCCSGNNDNQRRYGGWREAPPRRYRTRGYDYYGRPYAYGYRQPAYICCPGPGDCCCCVDACTCCCPCDIPIVCGECCCDGSCCAGGGEGGADAVASCGVVMLALVIVLAVLGVFVSIFFGTVVLQQAIQRHIHLLAMRAETKRTVVRDLRDVPREVLQYSVPTAPPLEELPGAAGGARAACAP